MSIRNGVMIMYQNYNDKVNDMANNNNDLNTSEAISGNPEQVKKKESHKVLKGLAFGLVFCLVAGGTFGGVYALNKSKNDNSKNQLIQEGTANTNVDTDGKNIGSKEGTIVSTNAVTGTTVNDVSGVAEAVMPSIVSINSVITQTGNFWGRPYSQDAQSAGSGIIIGQNDNILLIATNNHVVSNAKSVNVTFADQEAVEAAIKGTDSSNDLAVITVDMSKMKESTKKAIRIATLGDSDQTKVGEMVVAIGNALGYGQSVTVGYLSAKDREVQTDDFSMKLLQTDAAINPGNSGGALLNASGQVIGINSLKTASTEVEGIGYAIPITYAVPIINNLINNSDIPDSEKGYLGVRFSDIDPTYLQRYNMPKGIYVTMVKENSPASKGGLQIGDVITGIDDRSITSANAFQEYLSMKRGGSEVTITYQRVGSNGYEEKTAKITLGNRGDYSSSTETNPDNVPSNPNSGR